MLYFRHGNQVQENIIERAKLMKVETILSILLPAITIASFFLGRHDKKLDKERREAQNQEKNNGENTLINYRLNNIEKKLDELIVVVNNYKKEMRAEVKEQMEKEMQNHIKIYHGGK